jgi:hypothetical protein
MAQPNTVQSHGINRDSNGKFAPRWSGLAWTVGSFVLMCAGMQNAQAVQVVLNAIDTGLYTSAGGQLHTAYITGIDYAFGGENKGYIVFDLSSTQALGGQITSAQLLIQNRYSVNEVGPNDPLPLRIYGVTYANAGNFGSNAGNAAGNFGYIGSDPATMYSQHQVVAADYGTTIQTPINANGVNNLQANRGNDFYPYGMQITKADAQEPKPLQYVFGGSWVPGAKQVQLVLEISNPVPEPSPGWLLLAGLPLLAWQQRHKAKTSASGLTS